jgi:primosomal protein N' (replication factor Y)
VGAPLCRWCGRVDSAHRCGACGSRRLRAAVVGAGRTAEELGRGFPGTTVRMSGGGAPVLATAPARPELVVATPGAEPVPEGDGYGAALLLDAWSLLSRPDLRVAEEALRRWLAAAALVVPHSAGGRVVVVADAATPVVQALVRWDPVGHAAAELAARREVGFPPAVRMAAVDGPPDVVAELADEVAELVQAQVLGRPAPAHRAAGAASAAGPGSGGVLSLWDAPTPTTGASAAAGGPLDTPVCEVLGPVEVDPAPGDDPDTPRERMLLRVPREHGRTLAAAVHAAQGRRSARKAVEPVRVRLDPPDVG